MRGLFQIRAGFRFGADLQLGNEKVVVRLGGIYALEGVMNNSEQYHQPILEALSAFVRDGTRTATADGQPPAIDIQAALTVIGRRKVIETARPPVLLKVQIPRAFLVDANLRGANLFVANLTQAQLDLADLSNAFLLHANLTEATLGGATLSNADLLYANLAQADLSNADLRNADLSNANVRGARLNGADLTGAKVTQVQLYQACGTGVKLDAGLTLKPCSK